MDTQSFFPESERKAMKAICVALSVGVVLFTIVVLLTGPDPGAASDPSATSTMRIIHAILTLAIIPIQKFFYERILSGKIAVRALVGMSGFGIRYRTAAIVKLALFEGAALFGLVLFLVATIGGELQADPTIYVHLIPVFMLISVAISTFPTEAKVAELARTYGGSVESA